MRRAFVAALAFIVFANSAHAQEAPPPCGPAAQLPAELATNVAPDSRCFEVRMYTADVARNGVGDYERAIDELHQRFREEEVAIFERLGAEIVAVWQSLDDPNTLVWMLAYRDRAHREEVWAAFRQDPAWIALRAKYPVGVDMQVFMWSAADYSPLK
jgi:hypothetical protein